MGDPFSSFANVASPYHDASSPFTVTLVALVVVVPATVSFPLRVTLVSWLRGSVIEKVCTSGSAAAKLLVRCARFPAASYPYPNCSANRFVTPPDSLPNAVFNCPAASCV